MGSLYRRSAGKSAWQAEFTDHTGRRIQRSTRTTDKKVAQQILAHWESEAARRSSGLIDPAADRIQQQSRRPITDHVEEWLATLGHKSRQHQHDHRQRLEAIVDFCGWQTASEITPESVQRHLASLKELGRSHQTLNHYAQVAKQFTRWLVRQQRLDRDPLLTIEKPNPKADRRKSRRMLLPQEWPWLRDASGPNALLYETAIQTGLRSSELRSLMPSSIYLGPQPFVMIASGKTKDRITARQYISVDLADRLAAIRSKRLFTMPKIYEVAAMAKRDLQLARASWEKTVSKQKAAESDFLLTTNHAGEEFDFHALRHTCGAWLAMRGVHPKVIQTIMRHKSIALTMDTYGHLFPQSEPAAIAELSIILATGGLSSHEGA